MDEIVNELYKNDVSTSLPLKMCICKLPLCPKDSLLWAGLRMSPTETNSGFMKP